MRNLDPNIPLQGLLAKQLYQAMQGDVVNAIRLKLEGDFDVNLHGEQKSNCLPVTEKVLPELYAMCREVTEAIGFNEPIDFYISPDHEINACAIASDDHTTYPHIIVINSGLFNLLNGDELKSVIGHEVGHLVNGDTAILQLYNFIYPTAEDKERVPEFIAKRYDLWNRISELSADFYGYMACENLDACITAEFKMSSGLHLDKMNVRIADLMEINKGNLDFLLGKSMCIGGSHPVNPVRIEALYLFATAKTQKAFVEGMVPLMDVINSSFYSDLDCILADFYAAVGLYMCGQNGKLEKRAEELILNHVAEYNLNPAKVLKSVAKEDYSTMMSQGISIILDRYPERRKEVFMYAIELAFVDDVIENEEVDRIIEFGKALELPEDEIIDNLVNIIREHFEPQACLMK